MFRTGPAARIPAESPQSAKRTRSGARDDEEPRQTEFWLQGQHLVVAPPLVFGSGGQMLKRTLRTSPSSTT
jgi:hypothetical protein